MTKAQVTGDQSTSNTGTESSGRKKQDYLVVSVLERIAGRNNLWDEIINLNLFVVKSLVWWEFVVGLLSNYTHLCLAVCGVERIDCNRQRAIAPGFNNRDFRMVILPCKKHRYTIATRHMALLLLWTGWTGQSLKREK